MSISIVEDVEWGTNLLLDKQKYIIRHGLSVCLQLSLKTNNDNKHGTAAGKIRSEFKIFLVLHVCRGFTESKSLDMDSEWVWTSISCKPNCAHAQSVQD